MKTVSILLAAGIAGISTFSTPEARAELEVAATVRIHSTADFSTPLTACGTWVEVGSYGRCWHPVGVVAGWRPYCDGYWVWTDCGWYWASDEPWAWACYHYGWWAYDDFYGWVWVPGIEWAPCWVCWRFGGGFIGWAPLPPPRFFSVRRPVDAAFVFVGNDHFGSRIQSSVIIAGNADIFKQTKFVSRIQRVNRDVDGTGERKVIVNEGPGLDAIQRAVGKQFKAVAIREAVQRTPPARPDSGDQKSAQPSEKSEPKNAGKPDGQNPPPIPNQPAAPDGKNSTSPPGNSGQDQGNDQGGHGHGHGHGDF